MFKIGDKVTILNRKMNGKFFVEGKGTIQKVLDSQSNRCHIMFEDEPGILYPRFVDPEAQEDPEKYVQEANKELVES